MRDSETEKPKLGRNPWGLKRTVEAGQGQQSFSHGRKNTVVVEVKRRRLIGKPGEQAEAPPPPAAEQAKPAPAAAPRPAPKAPPPPPPSAPHRLMSRHESPRSEETGGGEECCVTWKTRMPPGP